MFVRAWYNGKKRKNASKIKLLALDVDGVLTDGSLNIGAEGELFKAFNARDGLGLSCLLRSGVRVAIITGRKSAIIHRRAEELGITELYEGIKDKRKILADLAAAGGLGQEEIAYMGDDLNDLPALLYAGLACAPADAAPEVIAASSFVAANNGGRGAVREAAEFILKAQGKWNEIVKCLYEAGTGRFTIMWLYYLLKKHELDNQPPAL